MKAVIQRVSKAEVKVDGVVVGTISHGLLVLVAVHTADGQDQVEWMADKVADLRIFPDSTGKMNLSLLETGGEALVVSQFTLYGDCRKGRRPSYGLAAPPELAATHYNAFVDRMQGKGIRVEKGIFGAYMEVELVNDGPVTLVVESPEN